MFKLLAIAVALLATVPAARAADETQAVTDGIRKIAPDAKIDSVTKSPVAGFYEVVADGQVLYASADGRYLLRGPLYDMIERKDLTEARLSGMRKTLLDKVPKDQRIVFAPKDPKYAVTVFTDIDCGYCRKLHNDIAQYNAQGIAVEYLWLPRSGPNTPSFDKAVSVWCAADRNKALSEAKAGAETKPARCDNPIAEQFALAQRLGINVTPTVIAPNGTQLGGYLPAEAMRQQLDALAAAK
ncbi:DsbC family protein [Tahibacter soli]|uniref:Thiol:disulfide interchange protein n=1 Tax=Tahibacter soli TaxID=2983605 RepID=A0A9X4BJJ5_9GAMM|nr:DsbC family protein [Tahibacter soli]MDC8014713.1 DsbC family protein [Tahibacter soli]